MEDKLLPFEIANLILDEYNRYHNRFRGINKRAKLRFESRHWRSLLADQKERLTLYRQAVGDTRNLLADMLGDKLKDRQTWRAAKEMYEELVLNLYYKDIAETFFNSVYRHVHKGLSVDRELMFVLPSHDSMTLKSARPIYHTYHANQSTEQLVRQLFNDFKFDANYEDIERDIELVTNKIHEKLLAQYKPDNDTRLEVLRSVFYRNKEAYVVGRAFLGGHIHPFIIPFQHKRNGIYADALLLEYNHIASLFTYYRSHFLVEVDIPSEMVEFLKSIVPHKPLSELYTTLGFEKHGKTEMYRHFLQYLDEHRDEKFDFAPGIKGMVMSCFTLPNYNMVFKIIKDNFAPPKNTSEKIVKQKYELVTQHDRVGRLADTHLFENFVVEKDRFTPELLAELRKIAKSKVILRGDKVEIKHLYVEKKMVPLNLYLQNASTEDMQEVLDDYGKALKQLAAANIFPGDLLMKNFGVTRLKRVVFYDYDEIEWVTDCQFRDIPQSRNHDDEMSSEAWYYVGEKDVFPEEFPPFLFTDVKQRHYFLEKHPEVFQARYWNEVKEKLKNGEIIDVYPYPETQRFGYGGWQSL
ncbi:MAG: bifunctional isocitrate dehydrogenase kinase/phosphatase [Saprospiraceae bacterium]|nr:bifunctional isocitrate dehydrogenase kinase/phosphatase [Saprospiraceae bacterium]